MRRKLFKFAAAASAALLAVACVVWARSYRHRFGAIRSATSEPRDRTDWLIAQRGRLHWACHSHDGSFGPDQAGVEYSWHDWPAGGRADPDWDYAVRRTDDGWQGLGVEFGHVTDFRPLSDPPIPNGYRVGIHIPFWLVVAGLAILPAVRLRRTLQARRARRPGPGQCRRCGYDVRATPEAGGTRLRRCPECGTAVTGPR